MSTSAAACLLFLQSCSSIRRLLQIHAHMLRRRFLDDPFAMTELLRSSIAFPFAGTLYARKLFAQIPHPTTFAWNSLLAALAASPSPASSLSLLRCMLSSGAIPNAHTFPPLVKACARLSDLTAGDQLHGLMIKCAAEHDVYSTNGLIHMYSACRRVDLGRRVFDTCTEHDAASWNCLLSGYVNCGLIDHARVVFNDMPQRGIISWNAMIHGYAKSGDITSARQLFDEMPERNVDSWNTLISAYGRCGQLDMSQKLFNEMPSKNAISWSAMITAYAQGDCPSQALALFESMRRLNVMPNCATIVSLLSACTQMGALEQGRLIHSYIERKKINVDSIIGTTLIDMYTKCGCVDSAVEVFDALVPKDVFSWTAMIGGLAMNGYATKALELFDQMEMEGIKPNEVTFVAVLCACSHGGLVEQARYLFDSMRVVHGLKPQIEHYACMVDVLGRAGLLEEAISIVQSMPHYKAALWEALFGACLIHGNAEMGKHIVDRLIELGLDDGGVYVLLANIYAMNGMWNDARRTRMIIKSKGLSKIPAYSSIEVEASSIVIEPSNPILANFTTTKSRQSPPCKLVGSLTTCLQANKVTSGQYHYQQMDANDPPINETLGELLSKITETAVNWV